MLPQHREITCSVHASVCYVDPMLNPSTLLARTSLMACLALLGLACSSNPDDKLVCPNTPTVAPDGPLLLGGNHCDPLVPTQCGFPFPSNVWLANDGTTTTGKRVAFGATTLPVVSGTGKNVDPVSWSDRDGFSPGQTILTHLPGATVDGLPSQDTIELSLTDESPTILINADTGEKIPHFAELDYSVATEPDEERSFMIRPVVRLADATRYIVAIRNVKDSTGATLPPTAAFKTLRDNEESCDTAINGRRDLYADIFAKLEKAGVSRKNLQIAWDYTTASTENTTGIMLAMRDDALAKVGKDGPDFKITSVENFTVAENARVARRIHGMMTVPLYLDQPGPGAHLMLDADGKPMQNGTADFEFVVHVPHAAEQGKKLALLQNGHGLLGTKFEGQNGFLAELGNRHDFLPFSVDFVGMAEDDEAFIRDGIVGDIGTFKRSVDRQHQGMINSLLAMRMMSGKFVSTPEVQYNGQSAIDPTLRFYRGDSQGGIFGVTYMALSTDVTRGLLGEPGMPYSLLLNRSVDFAPFFLLFKGAYQTSRNMQIVLGLLQMLWDRTEPTGYAAHLHGNPFPNTPDHEVLLHVAIGDYQVTPLGAHMIARTIGAKNLKPVNRSIFGIEEADGPFAGPGMVEFSFGLPESPKTNTPPPGPENDDPHDKVRVLDAAYSQTNDWLRTGMVVPYCTGTCDPE